MIDYGDTFELNTIHIKTDQNEDLSINEFLDKIENDKLSKIENL